MIGFRSPMLLCEVPRYEARVRARGARATLRRRSQGGFSLVETIAAIMIFSVGVFAVMEVFARCLHSTSANLGYTQAVCLAQEKVEETITDDLLFEQSDSGDFAPAYPRHTWTRDVTETEQPGLYEVEVVVSWDERGHERKYTLTTLVAERTET